MLYTIYKVTHKDTGKYYIGKHQTTNLDDGYMGSGRVLRNALKKHGVEAFYKEILHVFETEEEMNAKEAELVTEEFCKSDETYNLCPGGRGGWGYVNTLGSNNVGWKQNTRTKDHQRRGGSKSLGNKGPEFKNAAKVSFLGKTHTEESKKLISVKMSERRGILNSQFGSIWITNGSVNKKLRLEDTIPDGWNRGRVC